MSEPERDIEKTLKAYAKKRREEAGAPAELHPATRKLLQGEVARLRGKAPGRSGLWAQILGASWPQMALRVSVLVLLASTAVVLIPHLFKTKNEFEMAALRQHDEQAMAGKRVPEEKADGARPAYKTATEEESVRRKAADSTLRDLPAVKQERLSGELAATDKAAAAPGGAPASGKAWLTAKSAPPVSGLEKDRIADDTDNLAKKPFPATAQAASPVARFGLAQNVTVNPSTHTLDGNGATYDNKSTSAVAPATVAAAEPANSPTNYIAFATAPTIQPAIPPPAPAAVSVDSLATADREQRGIAPDASKISANTVTQLFTRANVSAKMKRALKVPGQIVLGSFRVEQTGNQIRVIDSDGSIYSGFLGQPAEGAKQSVTRAETSTVQSAPAGAAAIAGNNQAGQHNVAALGGAFQPVQNYFFRVSGTNRSSRQPVVFSGNFTGNIPVVPSAKSSLSNAAAPLELLNGRLQGRVVIGGSNKIEIIALPVKP